MKMNYGCPFCEIDTAGNHEESCPLRINDTKQFDYNQAFRVGYFAWECPRCHKINGPLKKVCDCEPMTVACSAGTGYDFQPIASDSVRVDGATGG